MLLNKAKVAIAEVEVTDQIVALVGLATFFFGFGAGALLNLYLLAINHPLVTQFRAALSYTSAIIGDGILLPIVNMIAVSFLLRNKEYVGKNSMQSAMLIGMGVTAYFHINQAVAGIVNWTMPAPWHWNVLGLWHAIYMFVVASLLALFYLTAIRVLVKEKEGGIEPVLVTAGIILFFVLLRLDYIAIDLTTLLPRL